MFLETLRGAHRAEASASVYNNVCTCNWASADASNKGFGMGSLFTDANGACLARDTFVSDIDVIATASKKLAGRITHTDIVAASTVKERINADGGVETSGGIFMQGTPTERGVLGAACVAQEPFKANRRIVPSHVVLQSANTNCRVSLAADVAQKRFPTISCVVDAASVSIERIKTSRRVAEAGCVVIERDATVGGVFAALCVALERLNSGGRVVRTGAVGTEGSFTSSRVAGASCVAKKRLITGGRVLVGSCVALERFFTGGR